MLLRIEQMFYFIVVITFLTLCLAIPTYMVIRENFITSPRYNLCMIFMAPSGAQGVTIFVRDAFRKKNKKISDICQKTNLPHPPYHIFDDIQFWRTTKGFTPLPPSLNLDEPLFSRNGSSINLGWFPGNFEQKTAYKTIFSIHTSYHILWILFFKTWRHITKPLEESPKSKICVFLMFSIFFFFWQTGLPPPPSPCFCQKKNINSICGLLGYPHPPVWQMSEIFFFFFSEGIP